jgi:heme oxygenase
MTRILEQILPQAVQQEVKDLHLTVENKPFLKRYLNKTDNSLMLVDHYRHLTQLKCIYTAFSTRLTNKHFSPSLPENLSCLLQRADKIEKDLLFLEPYVKDSAKNNILESTQQYVAYLNKLEDNNELLIHFLVSILGDKRWAIFKANCAKNVSK